MILVDTSVWIDFFAGRDLPHVATLEHWIHNHQDLALCGIILTEILQGIADDTSHRRVRLYLKSLIMLPMPETVFERAADIYRKLRKAGITVRKSNACIIAATVIEHHCQFIHNDKDFAGIAEYYPLRIVTYKSEI